MQKIQLIVILLLITISGMAYAQNGGGRVSGKVIDGSTKTIESATITLSYAKDSSMAKMSVAGKEGLFVFDGITDGKYFVTITAVGHQPASSPVFEMTGGKEVALQTLELVPLAKDIAGVTVTAKKPLVEMKGGKMLVNVDASPSNTGLNALEVLEKSPGVSVDNDGNISLKGKQGVTILVDGKPTYMSGADLAALLKSMQSSNLDQIEIMTNPPARYDASGNSGVINIKTKKGVIKGMNGNVNAGYTQGLYPRFNGGLNLNYRNDKLNLFGGYNGGTYEGFNRLNIDRNLYEADKTTLARTIDQLSRPHFKGNYHNLKLGVDYNFSKKNVAGIVFNGNFNDNDEDPRSKTNIRDAAGSLQSYLVSRANNTRKSSNYTFNFNYKHTFDSTGRELTTDLDYAYYDNKSKTMLYTDSYDKQGAHQSNVLLGGTIPSMIRIYSAKIDYVHPFKNGIKLEAGAKASLVNTDNQVGYERSTNSGAWTPDTERSNHFVYDENINAAYTTLSKTIKKWDLMAAVRVENTNAKGHQYSNDSSFKRNYTNLFPNVSIGYNMSSKHQFNLGYSRRVMRPDYDDLNPFVFFLDSLTFGQGNPYLQPQFTNNIEFSHTYNKFLTTTINYTQTNDIITELLKQNTEKNVTYQTRDNFSTMKQWGIVVMGNFPITKWWNANVYVNVYNNRYNGIYQMDPIEVQFTTFMGNMNNTFTFGKGWSAEISGWFRSKGAEGLLVADNMGALNSALSKQILKKKGTLKIGVRDILLTQQFNGWARYSDVDVTIRSRRDSRQFNIGFTYRFGKKNIAPERRRNSGASDEQNRVKSGN